MKNDLIMGWVFVLLALLMVFCLIYGIYNDNWEPIPICTFTLILNIVNATSRFSSYRRCKNWHKSIEEFQKSFEDCWPSKDDNRIE